jgi:hypothetical protein
MHFPNGRHPIVNVIRHLEKKKCNHDNYIPISYLLRCCHFHFHFLRVFFLIKAAEQFLVQNRGGLCYATKTPVRPF